jgi:hypothetical protein
MGHAFVLLMLLRGERLWETSDIPEYADISSILLLVLLTWLTRNLCLLCMIAKSRLTYDPKTQASVPKPEPRGPLTSAGFLIKSADLYLVCHATNRRPPAATDGSWTISKVHSRAHTLPYRIALTQSITQGIVNEGETPIEAAMRELQEETNIDLKGEEQLASLIPAPDAQPINSYTVGKGAAKKTVRSCQYMCVITAVSLTGT